MKTLKNQIIKPAPFLHPHLLEAGVDEAGRGCLAEPVFAASVILPKDFNNDMLTDSKMMSEKTGPAKQPLPASSTPASKRCGCKKGAGFMI